MVIPSWAQRLPVDLVYDECLQYRFTPEVILAIIDVESSGNRYACRYEDHFKWTHEVGKWASICGITKATEESLQKHSFGLMQIMGGTARWLGFDGHLPELFEAERGIAWGCKYFNKQFQKYGNIGPAVSAYNAGSSKMQRDGTYENQAYVTKVLNRLGEVR